MDQTKTALSQAITKKIRAQGGFLKTGDLPEIIATNRLQLLLVRCGGGRFLCPAQDLEHFIGIIEASGADYIRDVSLPAGE